MKGCVDSFSSHFIAREDDKPVKEIVENELLRITSREMLDLCITLFLQSPEQVFLLMSLSFRWRISHTKSY